MTSYENNVHHFVIYFRISQIFLGEFVGNIHADFVRKFHVKLLLTLRIQ